MTPIRFGLFCLALAGMVVPFVLAERFLAWLNPPGVSGVPAPLWLSLTAYTLALAVATVVLVLCYRRLAADRESSDKADGLDEREDLPY